MEHSDHICEVNEDYARDPFILSAFDRCCEEECCLDPERAAYLRSSSHFGTTQLGGT